MINKIKRLILIGRTHVDEAAHVSLLAGVHETNVVLRGSLRAAPRLRAVHAVVLRGRGVVPVLRSVT